MDPDGSGAPAQAEARAFDALYQAHYRDLVALLHALTGDLGDAQDLAQDVFCRAWQRWRVIVGYDDPVAWLRRVAVNLATSRFRRRRTADRHLARQQVEVVPALQPDHVALVAALRTLPTNQRTAMVLHYLVDLPVADVAQELGVPVGTVKAWLSRGRTALATRLGEAGRTAPATLAERNQRTPPATLAEQNQKTPPATLAERNQRTPPATLAERNQRTPPATLAERNQRTPPATLAEQNQKAPPDAEDRADAGPSGRTSGSVDGGRA